MNAKDEMNAVDLDAIEDLYRRYKADPGSVDEIFVISFRDLT
jgi:2-oxoglutarate dehydrogenase E1 component